MYLRWWDPSSPTSYGGVAADGPGMSKQRAHRPCSLAAVGRRRRQAARCGHHLAGHAPLVRGAGPAVRRAAPAGSGPGFRVILLKVMQAASLPSCRHACSCRAWLSCALTARPRQEIMRALYHPGPHAVSNPHVLLHDCLWLPNDQQETQRTHIRQKHCIWGYHPCDCGGTVGAMTPGRAAVRPPVRGPSAGRR